MTGTSKFISVTNARRPLWVGIDVGGTSIKLGIVDDLGRALAETAIPTESDRSPHEALPRIRTALDDIAAPIQITDDDFAAVGMGIPGPLDIRRGNILNPGNLPGWHNFPMQEYLTRLFGKMVRINNDANAAAFGEYWVGSGKDCNSIVLFTLGTGIGSGVIIDNQLIEGEHSTAAEFGHTIINYHDNARRCSCGAIGHLEAYSSAKSVINRANEALSRGATSSVRERMDRGETLTPKLLYEEASEGDLFSTDIILETARYMGIGVVNAIYTIDPTAVILGGGMTFGGNTSVLGRRFLDTVRNEVRRRIFSSLADHTVIDFADLGGNAGFVGAAGIARKELADAT